MLFSALPQRHIVPQIGSGLDHLGPLHSLPQGGFRRRSAGVEPVPPQADAPAGVGEADGVQRPAPGAHHRRPDPAAGLHQVYGLPRPYAPFRR